MKKIISFLAIILAMQVAAISQDAAKRTKEFNLNKSDVAIQGYDPVAYFKENKAIKGKKNLAVLAHGVTYYFSSLENRELFRKNYIAYEPQYGGWCAYAMGKDGDKVEVDPETFKIVNGKLYLFYNAFFNNTLKSWNKNEATLKANADQNWKKFY